GAEVGGTRHLERRLALRREPDARAVRRRSVHAEPEVLERAHRDLPASASTRPPFVAAATFAFGTTSTGWRAWWRTAVETLPKASRRNAPHPWEPRTMRRTTRSPAVSHLPPPPSPPPPTPPPH